MAGEGQHASTPARQATATVLHSMDVHASLAVSAKAVSRLTFYVSLLYSHVLEHSTVSPDLACGLFVIV